MPTKVKNNPRVYLPNERPVREETELKGRETMIETLIDKYNKQTKRPENLMPGERRGLNKQKKRSDIVVYLTDKSGKLCIATPEVYKRQGDPHTANDTVVTWKQVEDSQREMKGHLRAYNLIFQAGENIGEKGQNRVWQAKELESTVIPIMSQLLKDHKKVEPGQDAKSRPVCGASSSINGECSDWVSQIVDSTNSAIESKEVISCEELCGLIDGTQYVRRRDQQSRSRCSGTYEKEQTG